MTCEEILAALNEYVDGERGSAICAAFQEHLAQCNPCQLVVDNIRQTITLYKSGQPVELPAELHERLRELLRDRWQARFSGKGT
jgi:predicted anti-sigma-YlaC factor YlaD